MQDVTWAIAAGLARRKHAVTVITTRVPDGPERFEREGVEVCGLAGTRPERYSAAFFRGVATTFASLDRERRFDLVHSQSYAAAGLPAGLDRPLVVQLHGVWLSETELEPTVFRTLGPLDKASRLLRWPLIRAEIGRMHRFARRARVIVVDSAFSRDELARVNPSLGARDVRIVHPGIECDRLQPTERTVAKRRLGLDGIVLLCLGRLTAAKGALVAVKAFERLRTPGVRLLVAGAGGYKPTVVAYARERRLAGVSFVDVAEQDKALYLSAADLFVYPELTKPAFGLVAAEALACGTPVVASRAGAIPEVVGDCGALVEPGDVDALAAAIDTTLAAPDRRVEMGRRGRARVVARFGHERMLDALDAIYAELAPTA